MRIAFLADIHGNLPALEAVLADLARTTPDAVYLMGDQVNRCPWNNEVMDLLAERRWPAIRGNHEALLGVIGTEEMRYPLSERSLFPTLWWTAEQLHPHHVETLRAWPEELRIDSMPGTPRLRLLHGKPGNSFVGYVPETPDETLVTELADVADPVLVVAHTHRPMLRTVHRPTPDGVHKSWQLFNGGSVGMPYNGDPRAQYLLLDARGGEWQPTLRRVEYDRNGLAAAYERSGMREAVGLSVELHLRTALTGEPWSSDFGWWFRHHAGELRQNLDAAIEIYLQRHGPGNWAFPL